MFRAKQNFNISRTFPLREPTLGSRHSARCLSRKWFDGFCFTENYARNRRPSKCQLNLCRAKLIKRQVLNFLRGKTNELYGTLPHPATRPLKTHSMAVRAIPLPVCHHGPPNGYRTGFKRCSDAQLFFQLIVVDDINAKAVEA